eukprot:TRINITY_DN66603_c0_g1_i1.p1 TRINITY_DN66603_c0_g1~~TRINITY_DN66603_c0_g1_i1.p1  ORF type:complete len:454 (+),score=148.80 TRINITY_DN66603_c0_g1_i1:46-1362(+)
MATFLTAPPGAEAAAPLQRSATAGGALARLPSSLPAAGAVRESSAPPAAIKDKAKEERRKLTRDFVQRECRKDVSEEWKPPDDRKIAKLRGILAALQEENQSTQLLKRESENAEAKRALEETRRSAEARRQACEGREKAFLDKQAALLKHVKDSEKSLQELETNIEKAEKKTKEETNESKRLDREIAQLEKQLRDQEAGKADEQKKIAQTAQYKRFLEAVVQHADPEYEGDIENLMNRHRTLEAGNRELFQTNSDLITRLDHKREEALRVQTKLQNEHLMISSQLHECQVSLDKHRAESTEMEQRLNRALAEKELKESQVGVIHMAIEQLFMRAVTSCRLKQRRKAMFDAVDIKFAPVRGEKADSKLEEMLKQITERIQDLREMSRKAKDNESQEATILVAQPQLEVDVMEKVKFVTEYNVNRQPSTGGDESEHTAGS